MLPVYVMLGIYYFNLKNCYIIMNLRTFWRLFLVIVVSLDFVHSQKISCGYGSCKGTPNVTGKTNQLDGGTGNTILLSGQDSEYRFECCGLVTGWEYYGKTNTGYVYFQVWRDVANSPSTLAGENQHIHTGADGAYNVTVNANDRIQVKDGDYMGMHFPGNTFIPYHNGHQIQISNGGYTSSSLTFDWTAVLPTNNRDYAVKAYLEPYADLIIMTPSKSLDNTQDIQLRCYFGGNYNHIEVYPWTQRIGSTTVRKLNGSNTVKRSVLDIPYSSYQDVGTYTCSVYNHCGIKKTSIEVTVKDKPVITETIKMERQNQNEVITVDFYSIPKPLKVEWLKEDSILSLSEKYRQSTINVQISLTVHNAKVKMKGYRAQLIITKVTEKDYGIYKLRIENNKGIAIQLVEFQRKACTNGSFKGTPDVTDKTNHLDSGTAEKKEFNFIGVGIGVSIGIGVSFLTAAVVVTIIVIVRCREKNPGRREEVESDRTDELTYQELQISAETYVYNEPGTQRIHQSNINSNSDGQSGDREHSYLEPVTRPF